jgi:MSHA biogenesis protein MshN
MVIALGWVGWIAWQLQPRQPVATEQAFRAAESAQRKPAQIAVSPPAPAPAPKAPEQPPPVSQPAPPQPAADVLKLAKGIETPIREQSAKPAPKQEAKKAAREAPPAPPVEAKASGPKSEPPVAQSAPKVEKRDRVRSPEDRAEAEFRRGAALLNQGRTAEAEGSFHAALAGDPGHEAARQALIALHLELGRIDEARRLLQEGLARNPDNARFASVLARILIERKDYAAVLDVVAAVRSSGQADADLQLMRGTALQRLGRHAEAAEAFAASLRAAPKNGAGWMALGISLEALGKRPEASEAFRRAAASGSLSVPARDYAEQRARALQ